MKYVIKYNDGSYNRGMGHPVTLLEADVYPSKEEAELVAEDLTYDAQAIPCPEPVDLISQRNDAAKLYFNAKQVEIPELLRKINDLRQALEEIATLAHCTAKAGPLNTPTLADAWGKFMKINVMATNVLYSTRDKPNETKTTQN